MFLADGAVGCVGQLAFTRNQSGRISMIDCYDDLTERTFMMAKKPRWLENAIQYEKGFLQFLWQDIRTYKTFYYKIVAMFVVLSGSTTGLIVDFEHIDPDRGSFGIRAAICALGAAAIVFLNMVSTRTLARPVFDGIVRATGGLLALLAGVFWLLAETDGNIQPYIVPIVFNGFVMFSAACTVFIVAVVNQIEGAYKRLMKDSNVDS